MPFREKVAIIRELGKERISMPVALSALAGYILYSGSFGFKAVWLAIAVFFMSCGSATFNHIQEVRTDRLMTRTQKRPLPSGRISIRGAWTVALSFILAGSLLLITVFPPIALYVSWLTLFWYNLVYTPLKKVTAFAVVPGSVTGALPPIIGWVAAGGAFADQQILLVAAFFFLGQIPHFWILLLMFGDQYHMAGLPSLNHILTKIQIKRISFLWILATLAAALLVAGFVLTNKIVFLSMLLFIGYLVVTLVLRFLIRPDFKPLKAFYKLNFLYLFMMIALAAEGLLR